MPEQLSSPKNLLFVYGTLRQGCSNHKLLQNARYIGKGQSRRRFSLYVDDYPYVLKTGETSSIKGEVYEVDQQTWQEVDILEGHPNWYCRERQEILLDSGGTVLAWMYFFPEARGQLIPCGDYLCR
ncbi:MAG: gamma-glutamylcyclotransferase family protein [Desulfohalobiaceae bacterium]